MIPVATTTIEVLRLPADPTRDPEDPQPAPVSVASGVRAHISTSRGREVVQGQSTQEIVEFRLSCDTADIQQDDQVRDEATGEVYHVMWARSRSGLGLEHTQAGLKQVSGNVAAPRMAAR